METTAISFKNLSGATARADNSADTGRDMDVSADVNVVNGRVDGFYNGRCDKPGTGDAPTVTARFTRQANGIFSTTFENVADVDTQVAMQRCINAFMAAFDGLRLTVSPDTADTDEPTPVQP